MSSVRRASAIVVVGLWVSAAAISQPQESAAAAVQRQWSDETSAGVVSRPLPAGAVDPKAFGTEYATITVLSALQFNGYCHDIDEVTLSLRPCPGFGYSFYTTLNLPAGAVIDYIGANTATTADGALGLSLYVRNESNVTTPLASAWLPGHGGFDTDYIFVNTRVPANKDHVYVLRVDQAPGLAGFQLFGYVEIWWRRAVSDPPVSPTFGDVPGSHPFYQFVEALASSGITGGCGGGNYCPDAALTRGQMAVFLSKALGLHWPY